FLGSFSSTTQAPLPDKRRPSAAPRRRTSPLLGERTDTGAHTSPRDKPGVTRGWLRQSAAPSPACHSGIHSRNPVPASSTSTAKNLSPSRPPPLLPRDSRSAMRQRFVNPTV